MSENVMIVSNATGPELFGLMAEYPNVDSLLAAAKRVQTEGYTCWDCHTPFPVHGLDKVMKIKPTILPWLSLGGALTGVLIGLVLPLLVNGIAYPLNFSGKPYWGLPANVPVAFPLFILLGGAFNGGRLFPALWLAQIVSSAVYRQAIQACHR